MPGHGDDAGHCSKGLSARNSREANAEESVTYRKWMLGVIVFYCTLLLISGVVAIAIDASATSPCHGSIALDFVQRSLFLQAFA